MMKIIITIAGVFLFVSCVNRNNVSHEFAPLDSIHIIAQNYEENYVEYDLKSEIDIPDFVGQIYDMRTSWGALYFSDNKSIYTLKGNEVQEYFSPNQGRGPEEVTRLFRFDVITDSLIVVAGYPDHRLLIFDVLSDSIKILQTEYRGDVIIGDAETIIGVNTGHISNNMFQIINQKGEILNEFGHLFNNQYRSLNAFNLWIDTDDQRDRFAISFIYAGYYAGFTSNGELKFLTKSTKFPGALPRYVRRGDMAFIDSEGRVPSNTMGVYRDEFHVVSAYIAERRSEKPYGTVVDVMDLNTGLYQYSYRLNRVVQKIAIIDEYKIAGVTDDFKLALWEKIN